MYVDVRSIREETAIYIGIPSTYVYTFLFGDMQPDIQTF